MGGTAHLRQVPAARTGRVAAAQALLKVGGLNLSRLGDRSLQRLCDRSPHAAEVKEMNVWPMLERWCCGCCAALEDSWAGTSHLQPSPAAPALQNALRVPHYQARPGEAWQCCRSCGMSGWGGRAASSRCRPGLHPGAAGGGQRPTAGRGSSAVRQLLGRAEADRGDLTAGPPGR